MSRSATKAGTTIHYQDRLGRAFLAPRLHAANQTMFEDLARAAGYGAATPAVDGRRFG